MSKTRKPSKQKRKPLLKESTKRFLAAGILGGMGAGIGGTYYYARAKYPQPPEIRALNDMGVAATVGSLGLMSRDRYKNAKVWRRYEKGNK